MTVITPGPVTFGSNMQYILQQQLQHGGQGESVQRFAATVYCLATFQCLLFAIAPHTLANTTTNIPPTLWKTQEAEGTALEYHNSSKRKQTRSNFSG